MVGPWGFHLPGVLLWLPVGAQLPPLRPTGMEKTVAKLRDTCGGSIRNELGPQYPQVLILGRGGEEFPLIAVVAIIVAARHGPGVSNWILTSHLCRNLEPHLADEKTRVISQTIQVAWVGEAKTETHFHWAPRF